jgi:hypothetical protein
LNRIISCLKTHKSDDAFSFLRFEEDVGDVKVNADDVEYLNPYLDLVALTYYVNTLNIPKTLTSSVYSTDLTISYYILRFIPDEIIYAKENVTGVSKYGIVRSSNWVVFKNDQNESIYRTTNNVVRVNCHHDVPMTVGSKSNSQIDLKRDPFLSKTELKKKCQCSKNRATPYERSKQHGNNVAIRTENIIVKGNFPIISKYVTYECVISCNQTFEIDDNSKYRKKPKQQQLKKETNVYVDRFLYWEFFDRCSVYDRSKNFVRTNKESRFKHKHDQLACVNPLFETSNKHSMDLFLKIQTAHTLYSIIPTDQHHSDSTSIKEDVFKYSSDMTQRNIDIIFPTTTNNAGVVTVRQFLNCKETPNATVNRTIKAMKSHAMTQHLCYDRLNWLFPNLNHFFERFEKSISDCDFLKRGYAFRTKLYSAIFSKDVSIRSREKWLFRPFFEVFVVFLFVFEKWIKTLDRYASFRAYTTHFLKTVDHSDLKLLNDLLVAAKPNPDALIVDEYFYNETRPLFVFCDGLNYRFKNQSGNDHRAIIFDEYDFSVKKYPTDFSFESRDCKMFFERLADAKMLKKMKSVAYNGQQTMVHVNDASDVDDLNYMFEKYTTLEKYGRAHSCFCDIYDKNTDEHPVAYDEDYKTMVNREMDEHSDEEQSNIVKTMVISNRSFVVGLPGTGKTYCALKNKKIVNRTFLRTDITDISNVEYCVDRIYRNTITLTLTGSMTGELQKRGFENCKNICLFIFDVIKVKTFLPTETFRNTYVSSNRLVIDEHLALDDVGYYTIYIDEFSNISDELYALFLIALRKFKKIIEIAFDRPHVHVKIVYMMDCLQIQPINGDSLCKSIYTRGVVYSNALKCKTDPLSGLRQTKGILLPLVNPHRFSVVSDIYLCDILIITEEPTISYDKKKTALFSLFKVSTNASEIRNNIDSGRCYRVDKRVSLMDTIKYFFKITNAFDGSKSNGHILALCKDECDVINKMCSQINPNRFQKLGEKFDYVRNDRVMIVENMYNSKSMLQTLFSKHKKIPKFYVEKQKKFFSDLFNGQTYTFDGSVGFLLPLPNEMIEMMIMSVLNRTKQHFRRAESRSFDKEEQAKNILKCNEILENIKNYAERIKAAIYDNCWYDVNDPPNMLDEIDRFINGGEFQKLSPNMVKHVCEHVSFGRVLTVYRSKTATERFKSQHPRISEFLMPLVVFNDGSVGCPILFETTTLFNRSHSKCETVSFNTRTVSENMTYGWCTSVDKWQGRENSNVLFVSKNLSGTKKEIILNKSRFHVSVTRSKNSFGVVGDFDFFVDNCCSNFQEYDVERSIFSRLIIQTQTTGECDTS